MRTCALKSVAPMMSMPMMMPVTRCRCIYGLRTQSILTIARVLRHVLACVWSCVRVVAGMQHGGRPSDGVPTLCRLRKTGNTPMCWLVFRTLFTATDACML